MMSGDFVVVEIDNDDPQNYNGDSDGNNSNGYNNYNNGDNDDDYGCNGDNENNECNGDNDDDNDDCNGNDDDNNNCDNDSDNDGDGTAHDMPDGHGTVLLIDGSDGAQQGKGRDEQNEGNGNKPNPNINKNYHNNNKKKNWNKKNKANKSNNTYTNNNNNKNTNNNQNKLFNNNNNNNENNNSSPNPCVPHLQKNNNNNNNKNNNNNNKNNYNKNNNNKNYNNNKNNGNNSNTNHNDNNNKKNHNTIIQTKMDLVKYVTQFFKNEMEKRQHQPLNSWVLHLHYRFGALFFFLVFVAVACNWYIRDEITCISSFNADSTPKTYIVNICLSYSYLLMPDGSERYILFYRWVHYTFLLIAITFYLPRVFMKRFGNPRVKSLIEDLVRTSKLYLTDHHSTTREQIVAYFQENLGTHSHMYFVFLFNHIFSASISLLTFVLLNFVLQGKFVTLLESTFPFSRDVRNFLDPLSILFPPFVTCRIDGSSSMMNRRVETLSCHLALMEFYEKVFVFTWLFLTALLLIEGAAVLLLVLLFLFPSLSGRLFLRTALSSPSLDRTKAILVSKLEFGDLFLLFLVKGHGTEAQFCRVLEEVRKIVEVRGSLKEGQLECDQVFDFDSHNEHDKSRSSYIQEVFENFRFEANSKPSAPRRRMSVLA